MKEKVKLISLKDMTKESIHYRDFRGYTAENHEKKTEDDNNKTTYAPKSNSGHVLVLVHVQYQFHVIIVEQKPE